MARDPTLLLAICIFFFSRFGLGEAEAVLYCDNCRGQNKNNYMLWYLLWRVGHGLHKKISLNFMVPGHTKINLLRIGVLASSNKISGDLRCTALRTCVL